MESGLGENPQVKKRFGGKMKYVFIGKPKNYDISAFLDCLGNSPELKIIDFFITYISFNYSKKEVMKMLNIDKKIFERAWKKVLKYEIIKQKKNSKLYHLNRRSKAVKCLLTFDFDISSEEIRRLKKGMKK